MTLLPHEVYDVLAMSDVFTLPSFREGLASSIIEAAMAGLPIVSHPHSGGRFILQDDIWLNDMSPVGALTARLQEIKANGVPASKLADLQRSAELRFSRGALAHQFIDMVKRVHQI
jgi:glycosyltransferase involved in cell wall biosynthesis